MPEHSIDFVVIGAEATGGTTFGLSYQTSIFQSPMCNGNERNLTECPGFSLTSVSGQYCSTGNHQAGVLCIEGNL